MKLVNSTAVYSQVRIIRRILFRIIHAYSNEYGSGRERQLWSLLEETNSLDFTALERVIRESS